MNHTESELDHHEQTLNSDDEWTKYNNEEVYGSDKDESEVNEVDSDIDWKPPQKQACRKDPTVTHRKLKQSPATNIASVLPVLNEYYAVFFYARRSTKGTFYIGRVVKTDGQSLI